MRNDDLFWAPDSLRDPYTDGTIMCSWNCIKINPFTRVDYSTTTLWTCLFPIAGCLIGFYYYYVL